MPGETVAAALPFGTVLWIEGIGLRRVNDRGVGPGRVDVVTETRAQAFEIGRSRRRVYAGGDGVSSGVDACWCRLKWYTKSTVATGNRTG